MNRPTILALAGCSLLGASLSGAPLAHAQQWPATDPNYTPPPAGGAAAGGETFGDAGQLVISGEFDLDFLYSSTSWDEAMFESTGTGLAVAPALDFFLVRNLSLGGFVRLEYGKLERELGNMSVERTETSFSLGPQIGYNVPFSPVVSLFPRLGMAYKYVSESETGSDDVDGWGLSLFLSSPILFHPVPHLFLGIGPAFSVDLVSRWADEDSGPKSWTFGIFFDVGGWF